MNKLYVVTFQDNGGYFWTEPYLADDHGDATEQCLDANPPDIKIVSNVRIPFHMIERAYYLGKPKPLPG
jgi:hypothetical protein